MKGSLGLMVVLCLSGSFSISIWEDGKEYHFLEESAVHVGNNDLDSSAAGLRMMSDIRIQVFGEKLVVSIDNVQKAHFSHSYPRGGWPYRLMKENIEDPKSKYIPSLGYENGNTFSMNLEDGLVTSIELPDGVSVNGKNMMRALASILQVDTSGHKMGMWTRKEMSIHGECSYEYAFLQGDKDMVKEVSKTVSHIKGCVKRNYKMFDNSGAHSCNGVKDDVHTLWNGAMVEEHDKTHHHMTDNMYHPEPIHSTSMSTFQMKELAPKQFKIEKIFSSGAIVVQRFSEEGPTHATIANRTLTLMEVKNMDQPRQIQNPKTFKDLEFEWMEGNTIWNAPISVDELKQKESHFYNGFTMDETQDDLIETTKANIRNYVEELQHFHNPSTHREETILKLHQHEIVKLLPFLHALNYDSLIKLKTHYLGIRMDNEMDKASREIFLEILPMTGTWPAALVVQEIVMNNDLQSDFETAKMLTIIPFYVETVKALVEEFFKLVTQSSSIPHLQYPFTKSAIDLSYAHLVRRTCHEHSTKQDTPGLNICFICERTYLQLMIAFVPEH